jgi:plasmid stabilization system protein ParE
LPVRELTFSRRALASLQSYDDFLRPRNAATADTLKAEISHLCDLICEFPDMGRPVLDTGLRLHVSRKYRYRVVYKVVGDVIEIRDVLHPSRK